ncbi:MAG: two-component system, response regulator PdtaR [Petroclostridium sp.]|jgi:response regulator NasT|nr:response regulator with putative antiterminator output domain [Clostridia bacterium]MDK2810121.1 two-component system, response regulator PdtaR [Petroclostridium sp.]
MNHSDIIVAISNMDLGNRIRNVLNQNGLSVIDVCSSGNEAIRKVRMLKPDLLIINFELPDTTGFEVAKIIAGDKLSTVILLTNQTQKEYAESLIGDLDIICLNKPLNKTTLLQTIDLILRSKRKVKRLEAEVNELKKSLEHRKIIDRAKGILMEKLGLSEPEAYRKIQKQSMDTGVPMKDIAKVIIDTMQ